MTEYFPVNAEKMTKLLLRRRNYIVATILFTFVAAIFVLGFIHMFLELSAMK